MIGNVAGLRCLPRRAPPRGRGAGGKLERQQKTGQLMTPWCRCLNIFYSACKYFCQAWDERLLRRAASGRAATGGGPAAAATAAAPSTWTMWSSRWLWSSPDMGAVFDECLTMLFSNSVFGECNFSLKKDFCRTLLLDSFHKGEACLNYCTTSPNIIKTSLTCLFIPPSLQKTWHDDLLLQAPRLHAIFKGTGANGAGQATHLVFDRGKSLECLCDIAWYELKCWCPSAELDTSKDEGRPSFDERQKLSLGKFSASAIRLLSAEGNSQYHTFEKTLPSSSLWSWSGHLEKFIWLIQKSFAEKYGVLNSILVLRPYQCHCHLNRL